MIGFDLTGKVAVVAGAGRGIGAAVSTTLAAAGAQVLAVDARADRAAEVVAAITAAGGTAAPFTSELTADDAPEAISRTAVEVFGRVDILVTAAGGYQRITGKAPSTQTSDEVWDLVHAINVRYVFRLAKAFIEQLRAQASGGSIVCVSSMSGTGAVPGTIAYGAAKAGLNSLVQTLAVEYARDGIRVNAVAPGRIDTPAAPVRDPHGWNIPLGRVGTAQDVADVAVFLASDRAGYVTGAILPVDGGIGAAICLHEVNR